MEHLIFKEQFRHTSYGIAISKGQSPALLTEKAAKALKGQRIAIFSEGYGGQWTTYEFIVGDIRTRQWTKDEPFIKELFDHLGGTVCRFQLTPPAETFTGSDVDRPVYYVILTKDNDIYHLEQQRTTRARRLRALRPLVEIPDDNN